MCILYVCIIFFILYRLAISTQNVPTPATSAVGDRTAIIKDAVILVSQYMSVCQYVCMSVCIPLNGLLSVFIE